MLFLVPSAADAGAQFSISVPSGWQDRKDALGDSLVRQLVDPSEYAFIEVHEFDASSGGLEVQADRVEGMVRGNWPGVFTNRTGSQFVRLQGAEGILRSYQGQLSGQPVKALLFNTAGGKADYAVFGIWVDTGNYGAMVRSSLESFTHAGISPSSSGCASLLGDWYWTDGEKVTLEPGGRIRGYPDSSYTCGNGQLVVDWHGRFEEHLRYNADRDRLEGVSTQGSFPVLAHRRMAFEQECPDILGSWRWPNGQVVTFKPGGGVDGEPNSRWRCLMPEAQAFSVVWNDRILEVLELSRPDQLSGRSQPKPKVAFTAERVSGGGSAGGGQGSTAQLVAGAWGVKGCEHVPTIISVENGRVVRIHHIGGCTAVAAKDEHWESSDYEWTDHDTLRFSWRYLAPERYVGIGGTATFDFSSDWKTARLTMLNHQGKQLYSGQQYKLSGTNAPREAASPIEPSPRNSDGEGEGAREAKRYVWVHDATTDVWIKAPKGWESFAMGGGGFGRQLQVSKNSNTTLINLWIEEGYSMSVEKLAEHYESQTRGKPGNASTLLSTPWNMHNTKLKGADILCRQYSGSNTGVNTRTISCYMTRGKTLYFLQGTWPEGDTDAEHLIKQSLLSMRLEPVPQSWIDKSAGLKEFTK